MFDEQRTSLNLQNQREHDWLYPRSTEDGGVHCLITMKPLESRLDVILGKQLCLLFLVLSSLLGQFWCPLQLPLSDLLYMDL